MRHTKKKILPFVFASGLLASSLAHAAQLGKLEVLSSAGEPFVAEIQVDLVAPEERASLQAKLASAEAFKAARLTMDPNLKNLRFSVQDGAQPGTARVKITADKPLPAGFIDTLVELTWAGGRVAREYTLTIPVGPVAAQEAPATSLPEIRPPMTPPQATAPQSPPPQVAPNVGQQATARSRTPQARNLNEGDNLQVQRGDTLSELALELAGDGVSLNQAMAALYEANKDSFINGSVHMMREGAQIQVPNRAALRARSGNEALLVLAQNDDRNVYSAYARQIGLLTVENQGTADSATSTQGTIAAVQGSSAVAAPSEDRLQIAPGAASGTGNADASAEELAAKNKALAEANERIALLEKNVSDLQRLLDMQNDVAEPAAATGGDQAGTDAPDASETAAVELPSDALGDPADDQTDTATPVENTADATDGATDGVAAPVAETPAEDAPFDWMPWILGGAGGLAVLVILLLIARSRRNKADEEGSGFDTDDNASFSEVNEFDEAAASAASAGVAAEGASSLNKSEDSDFDLDEVLNDRLKQAEPDEATRLVPPVPADPVKDEQKPSTDNIPELNNASDEALQQKDSLNSEVNLEFPEEETLAAGSSNSILDDLDDIEKGTLAAQEELEEIRKQPVKTPDENDFDASSAFDDLIESDPSKQEKAADAEESSSEAENANTEDAFDQAMVDLDVDVPNPKVDDATWQEVATKLDLAGAYVEIGDADGAKELLNEIVKKGDVDQVRKAKALLATLN